MANIQLKTEIPGPKSRALMEERKKHVARGPFHVTPLFVARAEGALLEDVDGNRLIDFASGIGVMNVGHRHPKITEAIQAQTEKYLHVAFNVTPYEPYIRLAEKLNAAAPGDFAKKTFFANSGAEAVENAVKIARAATGRSAIVSFEHGFHGRTFMAMSLTSKAKPYKYGFAPFNPEVYHTAYPYAYRWPSGSDPARVSEECFKQFERLVLHEILPTQTAAVILEPVLGEGGFVPAPREFLQKLRAFCTEHKIVLIADEIQTGFGRTGSLFASEQLGFVPDLITSAKGLGGGMPISAVTGRAEIMDAPIEGAIGGTFGGNPLACAAALGVFEAFSDGKLLAQARKTGDLLRETLVSWQKTYSKIGDVRGLGPMQAFELVKDPATKEPDGDSAKKLVKACYEKGLIIMTSGTYGNVVRLLMPVTIEEATLKEGLQVLAHGLKECIST